MDTQRKKSVLSILGEKEHRIRSKNKQSVSQKRLNLLVDIDARLQAKGIGYQRWATVYNLKQMAADHDFPS